MVQWTSDGGGGLEPRLHVPLSNSPSKALGFIRTRASSKALTSAILKVTKTTVFGELVFGELTSLVLGKNNYYYKRRGSSLLC